MASEVATADDLQYQFNPITTGPLRFKVRAANDAHIALTSGPGESDPMWEVFIGGWSNTKSVIRKNRTKPDVTEVETPGILNAGEFRSFWIKWENGTITVGKGDEEEHFLTYTDPGNLQIGYYGICTGWGASGTWIIEATSRAAAVCWEKRANGEIAEGAVPGGTDAETGETLYVARAEHEGAVIPGKLVPSHGVAYIAWGGAEHGKAEYELLCGCQPTWIQAQDGQVPPGALEGGHTEEGEVLYIGRVQNEGRLVIGKVQTSHKVCYAPYGGQELSFPEYEVLVAN